MNTSRSTGLGRAAAKAALILAFATQIFIPQAFAADNPTLVVKGTAAGVSVSKSFDRAAMEEIGLVAIDTTTPWNEGVVHFEGVPIAQLLELSGVSGTTVTVTALNDYSVDIPTEDFEKFTVILAMKRNGEYMPVDDQGPFFVIYPFDSDPVLQGQPYHGRAVWQVKEIAVE
ncbi:MAG TPA: molybdopterin-dependent oxidoreductase [Devosia sp.]|jgi:hypothetical protein|nr:molybdopterin-dependent oxidoreductase [Devosia sp.]